MKLRLTSLILCIIISFVVFEHCSEEPEVEKPYTYYEYPAEKTLPMIEIPRNAFNTFINYYSLYYEDDGNLSFISSESDTSGINSSVIMSVSASGEYQRAWTDTSTGIKQTFPIAGTEVLVEFFNENIQQFDLSGNPTTSPKQIPYDSLGSCTILSDVNPVNGDLLFIKTNYNNNAEQYLCILDKDLNVKVDWFLMYIASDYHLEPGMTKVKFNNENNIICVAQESKRPYWPTYTYYKFFSSDGAALTEFNRFDGDNLSYEVFSHDGDFFVILLKYADKITLYKYNSSGQQDGDVRILHCIENPGGSNLQLASFPDGKFLIAYRIIAPDVNRTGLVHCPGLRVLRFNKDFSKEGDPLDIIDKCEHYSFFDYDMMATNNNNQFAIFWYEKYNEAAPYKIARYIY